MINSRKISRGLRLAASMVILVLHNQTSLSAEQMAPNILIVSVDTLRADHLGCYGFEDKFISPNIDKIAERGVLFEDTITTIGKTGPAFASMFTSEYPPVTGARRNGLRIRPDISVMAGILKRAGYTTAAIISNWTLKSKLCGLARGFDYYDEKLPETRRGPIAKERSADNVTAAGIQWLKEKAQQPFLLWIHYSDPHAPYEYRKRFAVRISEQSAKTNGAKKRRAYASEVRYTDHWIGEFLKEFSQKVPYDRTIIIFLSDHGESLGEHNYWGHGRNVLQPNLHIPLLIAGPGFPAGKRSNIPVSMVDILPTVLKSVGINAGNSHKGASVQDLLSYAGAHERLR
ncbi:MAG: sulfatase, partial [Lentisphaerae bacterium]|nr:sulfatase [Lentisphaerota bacterium]